MYCHSLCAPQVRHAAEDTKSRIDDTLSSADSKAHEVKVKGGRAVHRAGEKVRSTRASTNTSTIWRDTCVSVVSRCLAKDTESCVPMPAGCAKILSRA